MKNFGMGMLVFLCSLQACATSSVSIDFDVLAEAAACTPALSNNGVIDFGVKHAGSFSGSTFTQLGTRELTLTIQCESSTSIAITARDTRADSAIAGKDERGEEGARFQRNGREYVKEKNRLFGLGFTAEKRPIGSYAVQIIAEGVTAVDDDKSVSVDIGGSASKNGPWGISAQLSLPGNQDYFYTFLKKGTSEPQPINSATVPLQISATIANNLKSGEIIMLDGSAVISLIYL